MLVSFKILLVIVKLSAKPLQNTCKIVKLVKDCITNMPQNLFHSNGWLAMFDKLPLMYMGCANQQLPILVCQTKAFGGIKPFGAETNWVWLKMPLRCKNLVWLKNLF